MSPPSILDHFSSSAFDDRVERLINQWHVPGISIAILKDESSLSKGFGMATLDHPRRCTADTVFDIASSSKSLTAAAVGLLVEDEAFPSITWNTKMSHLLPEDFVMSDGKYTNEISIDDILSHRTGLPRHDDSYLSIRAANPDTPVSVTRNLRNLALSAPIRTKYQYCNMMFTVATHLIETLSKTTYYDFISTRILGPLAMTRTALQPSMADSLVGSDQMALPYTWDDGIETYRLLKIQETPEAQGAGSIITSAKDYLLWVKSLMYKENPVTESLYEDLTRARILADPEVSSDSRDPHKSFTAYAAGLEVYYYRGFQVVGHDGSIAGFGSRHFWMPEFNFGAVLLGNSNSACDVIEIIAKELVDELLGVPEDARTDWNARQRDLQARSEKEQEESNAINSLNPPLAATGPEEQKVPLEAYIGKYWNDGYHGVEVEIRNEKLYIDGSDRGFYLTFHHLRDQTTYAVDLKDYYDEIEDKNALLAEFFFNNGRVDKLGVMLESELDDYIWFTKSARGNAKARRIQTYQSDRYSMINDLSPRARQTLSNKYVQTLRRLILGAIYS